VLILVDLHLPQQGILWKAAWKSFGKPGYLLNWLPTYNAVT